MARSATAVLLLALLGGGAWAADSPLPAPAPTVPGPPIGHWMQPSWDPVSPEARIFLVAGSRDIANFAQEVIDQKKYWMDRGYAAEQIACFHAVPDPTQRIDSEQFLSLETALSECHLATPKAVLDAIRGIAQDYRHEFFYLYVTSHGSYPALQWPAELRQRIDPQGNWLEAAVAEAKADPSSQAFAWLGTYRIEMEAMRRDSDGGWGWVSFLGRYRDMHRADGIAAEDNLLTPGLLAGALEAFPAGVHRVVILQGCHSGGFVLGANEAPATHETLTGLSDVTVLTAARADRTSFGCAGGDRTTYYGGALQRVLDGLPRGEIPQLDWQRVHDEVSKEVQRLENASGIPEAQRSLPQFFTSHTASPQRKAPTARKDRRRR